jgi:MazG family protein
MSQNPNTAFPFEEPASVGEPRLDALQRLVAVVDRLRDPKSGCPWDLKQRAETLTASLVEEAFEVVEAIEERTGRAAAHDHVAEEAGDLLMNIVLIARIEEQAGRFSLAELAGDVADKLIRRHPHVFADVNVKSADDVLVNWEAIKKQERQDAKTDTSAVAGVPIALPALQRAYRVSGKAMSAGFRWEDSAGQLAKIAEELDEVKDAFGPGPEHDPARKAELEDELGDLLLASAFFGRYNKIDPEAALRKSLRKFEARFREVESSMGGDLSGKSLDEMMVAWDAAKVKLSPKA